MTATGATRLPNRWPALLAAAPYPAADLMAVIIVRQPVHRLNVEALLLLRRASRQHRDNTRTAL